MEKHLHHIIIYIATALLSAACENEIPYIPAQGQLCLLMNALLEAGEGKTNYVYLHLSEGDNIGKVNRDATLRLYVNDALAEMPLNVTNEEILPYDSTTWSNYEQYEEYLSYLPFKKFHLTTPLHPGDHIRLEATAERGTLNAVAETDVPLPPEAFRVDTATVIRTEDYYKGPHYRYLITLTDRPNERNYYRLDIRNDFRVRYHFTASEHDSLTYEQMNTPVINREDIILTDGHITHTEEESDNELFPRIENIYNIFADTYFPGASTTLKVYTRRGDDFRASPLSFSNVPHLTYCTQRICVSLYSLTEETYRYLQALNCLDDDDYDNTLMEPVSLPNNVSGGVGFVGVLVPREVYFTFPERPCEEDEE